MLFEVVRVNDVIIYCEQNNLMLIDKMCTEELLNYNMSMFIGGMVLGAAGMLLVISVLIAPALPSGDGLKV
jgi:hypothetical protein